jgi:hypothetical protein
MARAGVESELDLVIAKALQERGIAPAVLVGRRFVHVYRVSWLGPLIEVFVPLSLGVTGASRATGFPAGRHAARGRIRRRSWGHSADGNSPRQAHS